MPAHGTLTRAAPAARHLQHVNITDFAARTDIPVSTLSAIRNDRFTHIGQTLSDTILNTPTDGPPAPGRTAEPTRPWMTAAACTGVDPDLFFPARGASTDDAKAVCRSCPVRLQCLEYALANGEKCGVWGGLSERERRRIRRDRRRTA
jgi:WhiB family redox-sensing transcriptional regulator